MIYLYIVSKMCAIKSFYSGPTQIDLANEYAWMQFENKAHCLI